MSTPQPVILAIETSQRTGGVALRDRAGVIHTEMLAAKKRHDDDLLPAIDRVFARAGLEPRDLAGGGVGVSIGPGGFTGLRIAITTAKMLAEVLHADIAAVPSAFVAGEAYFQAAPGSAGPIIIALASKGETFWSTRLVRTADGGIASVGEPGLADGDSLELAGVEAVLGDEHLPLSVRARCESAGVAVVEPAFDPRACLQVASRMIVRGQVTDPLALSPLYPRPPEAVSLWEKRRGQT